jgi:hypothetical protein
MQYNKRITKLINLNIDNLNNFTYSQLFLKEAFYANIPTETFLVFQTDSLILNKDMINLFLDYDYIGAPWLNKNVGNGGLSIRKKNKMLEIVKKKGFIRDIHEDVYFSYNIDADINYNIANFEVALTFSVETVFYDNPFGIHNCWRYINSNDMKILTNKYPEILKLIELQ